MTAAIIKQIESLGYIVKVFRINDTVEMHAVPLRGVDAMTAMGRMKSIAPPVCWLRRWGLTLRDNGT